MLGLNRPGRHACSDHTSTVPAAGRLIRGLSSRERQEARKASTRVVAAPACRAPDPLSLIGGSAPGRRHHVVHETLSSFELRLGLAILDPDHQALLVPLGGITEAMQVLRVPSP